MVSPEYLSLALWVLVGAASPAPDRLTRVLAELRRSDEAPYGCFEHEPPLLSRDDANTVASWYQRSRGLENAASSRALLAALVEYKLRPTPKGFGSLRRALDAAGPTVAATEDVCRCVYFAGQENRVEQMTSMPVPAVGELWAARVLHEDGRIDEALVHYRLALQADTTAPRTRLLLGIALIADKRSSEALGILSAVPEDWAPGPVAYWRARALLESGDAPSARRLLEPIQEGWTNAATVPDAWIGSFPVAPFPRASCLLGRALVAMGQELTARAVLEKDRECRGELGRLELRQGRLFDALLLLEHSLRYEDPLELDAMVGLGACAWAQKEVAGWHEMCAREIPPEGCERLAESEQVVVSSCAPPAQEEETASDAALEARLRAPRLVAFEERAVPKAQRWRGKRPRAPLSDKAYPALAEVAVVALSPPAERMFVVSVSQDIDSRGEVSAGGYWLRLSSDRGQTWRGPFYLGFAHQFPYVVLARSRVPAFDGERIQLEVERREVDVSTISFPPTGLRATSVKRNLLLSIDVAAVERDSDADGLTDLLEEKLALDPLSSDTDGDEIPDGSDPLPLQARTAAESSDSVEVLAAALPYLFRGVAPVQQTASAGAAASSMSPQQRPFASARTLFVSGTSVPLPHAAGVRAIAFSPRLFELYRQKFGATFPVDFPDIAFDRDRRRALIRYDFGWRGGSLIAEKKDGTWRITVRERWIT